MELYDWAIQILSSSSLEDKLFTPDTLTDDIPREPLFIDLPVRASNMAFQKHTRKEKLPKLHELGQKDKRAICLHRFGGHELLAVEIMAFAILAFPYAPKTFRKGLAKTLQDEQGHVRLYCKRLQELGVCFGDLPLYRHFWSYIPYINSIERYISLMSLTFEMANLDFAPHYGSYFLKYGDEASSQLMLQILKDEIAHVSFGMRWLKRFKDPCISEWDAWCSHLPDRVTPKRAKGALFQEMPRLKAGVSKEWIENLKNFS